MKYHGEYEVDSAFTDCGSIKWRLTGNGEYIIGIKNGRKYFIKRNMHVRYPSKDEPKSVYEKYKAEADAIYNKQNALRKSISGLSFEKDRIVVEETNFWDEENMFTTVTCCVDNILPDSYNYRVLDKTSFVKLCKETAILLQKLHTYGVIHGDLKEKNIIVVKKGDKYLPYLIDFDSSYLASEIPDWDGIGGTDGYQSPELLLYGSDEGAAASSTITTATDIFTLGVVMHRWWTGSFPSFDLDKGSVGAAVYLEKSIKIDSKFNVKIGDIRGATLISLINWMLAKEPSLRPTAEQVVAVLSDALEVPETFHKGNDEKPFDKDLWEVHKPVAELCSVEELKGKGVKSFKRLNTGCGSAGLKYRIVMNDGADNTISIEEVIVGGFAKRLEATVDEPWEEHCIELVSPEEISEKGYVKIIKTQLAYRKRYLVTTNTGREFDKGYEWLIAEGLAKPKIGDVEADTPWPEHGTAYSFDNMAKLGIKSISRVEVAGEHRYKIVYNETIDGKNRVNEKVPASNLKIMGFIK